MRNMNSAKEMPTVVYMPFSMLLKIVTKTPAKNMGTSNGEILQNWNTVLGGVIKSSTACIMTPDNAALGMYQNMAGRA